MRVVLSGSQTQPHSSQVEDRSAIRIPILDRAADRARLRGRSDRPRGVLWRRTVPVF
jgi:hypothetical protein